MSTAALSTNNQFNITTDLVWLNVVDITYGSGNTTGTAPVVATYRSQQASSNSPTRSPSRSPTSSPTVGNHSGGGDGGDGGGDHNGGEGGDNEANRGDDSFNRIYFTFDTTSQPSEIIWDPNFGTSSSITIDTSTGTSSSASMAYLSIMAMICGVVLVL